MSPRPSFPAYVHPLTCFRSLRRNWSALIAALGGAANVLLGASLLVGAGGCTNTLNRAIYRENPERVEKYLAEGANVNEANDDGSTPLIYAAQYSDLPLIKTLVERGADVNRQNKEGNSALSYLASGKVFKNDCVAFLLAHGARVNEPNRAGLTPLHLAASRMNADTDTAREIELVEMLLRGGADPMLPDRDGKIALHLAAAVDQPDAVMTVLHAATKDPQVSNHLGHNALSTAARVGAHRSALFLLQHGVAPQSFVAEPIFTPDLSPRIDSAYAINARTQEVVGDDALSQGNSTKALTAFRASAEHYQLAVTECRRVVGLYDTALTDAKAGKKSRGLKIFAANVVGGGLAAATGFGFMVVPKRGVNNHIDEFSEALGNSQLELAAVTSDQARLVAKLEPLAAKAPPSEAPASNAVPAVLATIPSAQ